MRFNYGIIYAKNSRINLLKLSNIISAGTELTVSARCIISAVKNQYDILAWDFVKCNILSSMRFQDKIMRLLPYEIFFCHLILLKRYHKTRGQNLQQFYRHIVFFIKPHFSSPAVVACLQSHPLSDANIRSLFHLSASIYKLICRQ